MQTIYVQTSHFIQHSGNVVDLDQYRQRMAAVQQDALARRPSSLHREETPGPEEAGFSPVVLTLSREERRRFRRERWGWRLDICASLAVILMTLVFVLGIML